MARGKIEIKKIENNTNRQVTFSKRRNGLFKKAHELSILCDAKISVIVLSGSSSSKSYHYHTPSTSIKEIVDLYQKTTGVDVWSSQYQRMEDNLRKLKDTNAQLRLQIRRRLGHSLESMSHKQLVHLEEEVDGSMKVIRERKLKVISNKTETSTRKVRNEKNIFRDNHGYEPSDEEIKYWQVKNITDIAEMYEPVIEFFDGVAPRVLSRLRHPQFDPSNYLASPWQQHI